MKRLVLPVVFWFAVLPACSSSDRGGGGAGAAGSTTGTAGDGGATDCDGFDKACCGQFKTEEDCHANSFPPGTLCSWIPVFEVTAFATCEMTGPTQKCIPRSIGQTGGICTPANPHQYLYRERDDGTIQVIDLHPCVSTANGSSYIGWFEQCNPPAPDPHPVCDCFLPPAN